MTRMMAAGLGEILWDMLPEGPKLGGAPANFAYQFTALGGHGLPVTRVGDDEQGREALALLQERGVDVSAITVDPKHPTGRVDITLDADGVPEYVFPPDVAWDFIELNDAAKNAAVQLDAVCFGTLAQRNAVSAASIRRFLDILPSKVLKVFDINIRQEFYTPEIIRRSLRMADVLKINDEELDLVARLFVKKRRGVDALVHLREEYKLKMAVLTRGNGGSLIVASEGLSDLPGASVRVVDTVGAGDSFTAAMVLATLKGTSIEDTNRYATECAAYVCTQAGAMPDMPESLVLK